MILAGEILLKPAQDHDVVTPLAAVVSASMPLHTIYDAWGGRQRVYAPINGGSRPAMRLGLRSEAVLDHIRWLNTWFLDVLQNGIAEGIALVPLAAVGLIGGDDCHGRTPVAGAALAAELIDRTRSGITDDNALEFLHSSPSLFLNPLDGSNKVHDEVGGRDRRVQFCHRRRWQRAHGWHPSLGVAGTVVYRARRRPYRTVRC